MDDPQIFAMLADAVLTLHVGVVLFVVVGFAAIVVGNLAGWQSVNAFWFRVAHAVAIGIVVLQSWLGQACPLTVLEVWLRERAGQATYDGSFIAHWLGEILFYEAEPWVFTTVYTLFGLVVAATGWIFPPRRRR